jgi:hypothetical protein
MIVRNSTRGTSVSESVRILTRWGETAQGLIAETTPEAVLLRTRWGIHTFGVKFPIDVVVYDSTNTVRAVCESLKPFRFFFWNPQWENVLELPTGTIAATRTEVGDTLQCE